MPCYQILAMSLAHKFLSSFFLVHVKDNHSITCISINLSSVVCRYRMSFAKFYIKPSFENSVIQTGPMNVYLNWNGTKINVHNTYKILKNLHSIFSVHYIILYAWKPSMQFNEIWTHKSVFFVLTDHLFCVYTPACHSCSELIITLTYSSLV